MAASTVRAIIGGVSGSDDAQRLVAVVHGNVQGVGFRWYVQREADRIGLVGWVANRRDGRVEVVAEGPEDALRSMVAALHDGPAGASVASVDVRYEPARHDLRAFDIRVGEHRGD